MMELICGREDISYTEKLQVMSIDTLPLLGTEGLCPIQNSYDKILNPHVTVVGGR